MKPLNNEEIIKIVKEEFVENFKSIDYSLVKEVEESFEQILVLKDKQFAEAVNNFEEDLEYCMITPEAEIQIKELHKKHFGNFSEDNSPQKPSPFGESKGMHSHNPEDTEPEVTELNDNLGSVDKEPEENSNLPFDETSGSQNKICEENYNKYLKDFDEKVMLNNWFPLELRDRVFEVIEKRFKPQIQEGCFRDLPNDDGEIICGCSKCREKKE